PAGPNPAPTASAPLIGRGNEPGWRVAIGAAEIELITDYGAGRATFPAPAPERSGDVTRYVVADADLTITFVARPCVDTMSGMSYPFTVTIERSEGVLAGCGGEPAALLHGPVWAVERIGDEPVLGDAPVTIEFGEDGRIAGLASCNRYLATYELTGEGLSIAGGAATMMACARADGAGASLPRRAGRRAAVRDRARWRPRPARRRRAAAGGAAVMAGRGRMVPCAPGRGSWFGPPSR